MRQMESLSGSPGIPRTYGMRYDRACLRGCSRFSVARHFFLEIVASDMSTQACEILSCLIGRMSRFCGYGI
jgi:hypothetical protein